MKREPKKGGEKNLCQNKDATACKANTTQQKAGNCLRRVILKMPAVTLPPTTHTQGPQLQGLEETVTIFECR